MNTVFVIGAGASKEVNLPTGNELKSRIAELLDIRYSISQKISGDDLITYALHSLAKIDHRQPGDINPYLVESWHIRDALPQAISIDNFIDSQKGNDKIATCGKLAIIRSILEAEKNSKLYHIKKDGHNKYSFSMLGKTWYESFFQILCENCSKNDIENRFKKISLIIFNYDRCVEHFIYHALQNYYRITETQAAGLMKTIKIYHPYGIVGSLPWQNLTHANIEYGGEPNPQQLIDLSKTIKTFTEGTDPQSSEIDEIKNHMILADKIIYLGFAFHKLNMQLLTPKVKPPKKHISFYASALGISEDNVEVIKKQIADSYSPTKVTVKMINKNCHGVFEEYWKSISFA